MNNLVGLAREVRRASLASIHEAGSGHPGGALSCADLVSYIFSRELGSESWPSEGRNRFVLSKGHACPVLYAAASLIGTVNSSALNSLRALGSDLQGHPCVLKTPWVEASTGSLGQGFSAAIGMALGLRFQGNDARVYALLGDGELQEGQVWEGLMFAAHNKLDNLCAIVDYNKLQSDELNENIVGLEPLSNKFVSFNWHVLEIDGHDFVQIEKALDEARETKERPTVIIAHTIKGKGVSYMEGHPAWHGSVKMSDEDLEKALADLERN